MNIWGWNSIRHLQCSFEDRGFQLKNLQHIYERAKVINFLNNGLNSRDDKIAAVTSEEALKIGTPLVEEVKDILHRISKLSIHDTTAEEDFRNRWVLRADLWLDRQIDSDIINKLKRAGVTKTTDLFDEKQKTAYTRTAEWYA